MGPADNIVQSRRNNRYNCQEHTSRRSGSEKTEKKCSQDQLDIHRLPHQTTTGDSSLKSSAIAKPPSSPENVVVGRIITAVRR